MKKCLPLLLALVLPVLLAGQQLNHVLGEALIRLEPKASVQSLTGRLQTFNGRSTNFKIIEEVVPYMRIWRVGFDHTAVSEIDFLAHLNRMPGISVAQFNHLVELRSTVPDDPEFQNQWQYINGGSGSCVEGADIDADLAWEITTGGTNALGDDIVVCIVDDGLDPNHQDFGDNVWVNVAEIPGNGIDDDNNGFIDDYAGWNTGSDDDDIDASNGHGTPVAGIVGAQGNNGIGVAGVNWDVKLMIVVGGSGIESEVLEAYSFPLAHRMRYNETGGAEGSFVVATNSSWGVNFGQPEDAPLWCAFYDTLGVHGILNAGATINGNQNVDEVGDLPTACSSDFMISVTNLNCTGNKVSGAGFGIETIDLGAPGQGTWTAAEGNTYGGFGGTSGATPHVAGAIALLYSAPCSQLTQLSLEAPAEAALLVRRAIFDGVKPNPSLDSITVTGGTLNLYNSLQMLLQNCGPCPGAFGLEATAVTDSSATISWVSTDSTLQSSLYWRESGDTTWQIIPDAMAPVELSGLLSCSAYEFALEETCTDTTVFSTIATFLTDGCCDAPQDLFAESTVDSTVLSWRPVSAASAYQVTVTCLMDTLTYDSVFTNTLTVTGLDSCQTCVANIQSLCSDDLLPDSLGTDILFDVPGCGNCIDLDYCLVTGNTEYEFINAVSINDLENTSGNDGGYGDYTGLSTSLETGAGYTLTITPGWVTSAYSENYWVLIDLNQDGTFDLSTEVVGSVTDSEETSIEIPILIPDDALTGSTRMRVAMAFQEDQLPECNNSIEGETEDYCLEITDEVPPCPVPAAVTTDSISYQSAYLSWEGSSEVYQLRFRPEGAAEWSGVEGVGAQMLILEGLDVCTGYEVQVSGFCGDFPSGWSESFFFSTICNPACDSDAAMLTVLDLTDTTAMLVWAAPDAALSYELQVRRSGTTAWDTYPTTGLELQLENLDSCSAYDARIWVTCEGVNNISQPSATMNFETTCLTGTENLARQLRLEVAPNPFRETLGIQLELQQAQAVQYLLYNAAGQQLLQQEETLAQGVQQSSLSTATLPAGLYWLSVRTERGVATIKVIKQ
ncbi:S8 family serine peptidase [Phaeodactylibacter xiamenensis]|uniref:S8 family serine peptidase n=1 Tax=Phaeodactylibacter xiamenensis TaxID=1524460 RepID=UPI003BAD1020